MHSFAPQAWIMQLSIVPSSFKPIKSDVHRCLLHNYKDSYYMAVYIKTHNSESGGQEKLSYLQVAPLKNS